MKNALFVVYLFFIERFLVPKRVDFDNNCFLLLKMTLADEKRKFKSGNTGKIDLCVGSHQPKRNNPRF